MLAGPESTAETMIYALSESLHALDAASELDLDRTPDDRGFFGARKLLLAPILTKLVAAERALEDHDLNEGSRLQVRVVIGDEVLDRGVRDGSARTKLALRGKPGLDATHAFGKNIADLTGARIAVEPRLVREAADRLDDLADFPERGAIAADLQKRAGQQQTCLDEREAGKAKRAKLVTAVTKVVMEGADALAALKGALDERFPRQRDYVAAFFLDVAPRRKAAEGAEKAPKAGDAKNPAPEPEKKAGDAKDPAPEPEKKAPGGTDPKPDPA